MKLIANELILLNYALKSRAVFYALGAKLIVPPGINAIFVILQNVFQNDVRISIVKYAVPA